MNHWERYLAKDGTARYSYKNDRSYELRTVLDMCGQVAFWVWALFYKEQRIHEVHAMERIGFVRSDAEDYIMEVAA